MKATEPCLSYPVFRFTIESRSGYPNAKPPLVGTNALGIELSDEDTRAVVVAKPNYLAGLVP